MDKLRILEIASEAAPFSRTGGLGDVLGALPSALEKLGHEVKVILPLYGSVDRTAHRITPAGISFPVEVAGAAQTCVVESVSTPRKHLVHYFFSNAKYFGRAAQYVDPVTGEDFEDNDERFIFFCRAALVVVKQLNWRPDIIHVHDWQAALVPAYLRTAFSGDEFFSDIKSVLTIHNLGFQGLFPGKQFKWLGVPDRMFYAVTGPFEFFGKVNFLKGGISTADWITTVSERYAQEIQSGEEFGCGLQGILKERNHRLTGILNGVDYTVWSPTRDEQIPYRFSTSNLTGKRENKIELLRSARLPLRENVPLIGIVSRLTDQKGWDLVEEAAEKLFAFNLQVVVLGNGDPKYHETLALLEKKYPDKLKAYLKFDDGLAHRIEAGADMFLMPSRWEPCGLNQMYSLKYGTVPIVREVGGLADTVEDFNAETGSGTGFVFKKYTAESMLYAVERALRVFGQKRTWTRLMKAGMAKDFSWESSARKYAELFARVLERG